jgi:hypothetical protein
MSYPINYPTPQGANVQIFTPNSESSRDRPSATWVKPQGASMVWFTLIGAGGSGGNATTDASAGDAAAGGGGSGAVTNCMVPAFLIPDILNIRVYQGGVAAAGLDTNVLYLQKTGTGYTLLNANGGGEGGAANSVGGVTSNGTGGTGGGASNSNQFAASGFFQSIAGQDGRAGNSNSTTSLTTFLQGGVGGGATGAASQYGYSRATLSATNQFGYGIMSPILVSVTSTDPSSTYRSASSALEARNGFGCGGGGAFVTSVVGPLDTAYGTRGGDGLVVIVTW